MIKKNDYKRLEMAIKRIDRILRPGRGIWAYPSPILFHQSRKKQTLRLLFINNPVNK